jgi:hypothetical protein
MLLHLTLFCFASSYNVMRTSNNAVEQPDDSWFPSESRRTRQDKRSFYQPRYNPQIRFSRYFNNDLLTDKECLEVILESIKHNDLENPVEECADLHRLITSYISRH